MSFDALEVSLTMLRQLAPLEAKLRQRRKSLADEVVRAGESVALNISEVARGSGSIALTSIVAPPVARTS